MYQKQAIKMPDPRSNEPGECRALLSARAGRASFQARGGGGAGGLAWSPRRGAKCRCSTTRPGCPRWPPPRRHLRSPSSRLGGSRTPGYLPAEIYDLGSDPGPLCAPDAAVRTCGWRPMGAQGGGRGSGEPQGCFFWITSVIKKTSCD